MKKRLLKANTDGNAGRLNGSKRTKAEHDGWLKPKSNARTRVGSDFQCTSLPPYSPPCSGTASTTTTATTGVVEPDGAIHPDVTVALTDGSVTALPAASSPTAMLTTLALAAAELTPCCEQEQLSCITTPRTSE